MFGTLAPTDVDVLADGKTVKVAVQGSDAVKFGKLELATPAGFVNDRALTPVASKVKKYVVDFGAASATPLKVQSVTATANRNDYTVRVDDAVTYASATNPSNYSVNGVALPANTTIVFDATNKDRVTVTS